MSDGSTSQVTVAWKSISDRMVFGNNGPALADFGLVRHTVNKCSTQVNQGHQKFRLAAMTGTVDGVPVHSYSAFSRERAMTRYTSAATAPERSGEWLRTTIGG